MGDKISQLPSATTPLTGSELVLVIQGGTTSKVASSAFRTTNANELVSGTVNTARLPAASTISPGIVQYGSTTGTACQGDDVRLSDSRTPSGAAGGDLAGTYPSPSLAASGVTAGTYGSGTITPVVTVDAKGRVTNVGQVNIPIPQASNSNPLADGIAQSGFSSTFSRADHIHPAPSTTLTGDVTGSGVGIVPATLSNTGVSQGTYGSSSLVPVVTVDAKGRVLAVAETPFSSSQGGTVTSVDASGGTTGLTVSGGPITDTGTLTLGGTLGIASGGTGSTSAAAALSALGGVPLSLVGVSSGVASLDSSGLVPLSQLPNMVTGSYATLDGNSKVPLSQLYAGTASGLATLDAGGKVPSGQLPSYVDDVIEVANFAALPVTGVAGIIYVTLDTNLTYRWTGSTYVQISAGPTPSSTTPIVAGTAAVGTSLAYARADHIHPAQAFANVDGGSPSSVGTLIQLRRGTTALWTSSNPVLSAAEIGVDTTVGSLKVGDGSTSWNNLPYASAGSSQLRFNNYLVEYVIAAGGGGGAANWAAGGGAGGYRSSVVGENSGGGTNAESRATVSAGTSYTITVGAGGASGSSGSNSSAFGLTATGGGFSGGSNSNAGASGGSGAGGWNVAGYSGTSGQGFAGGTGLATTGAPGGGGGAGAVGANGSATGGSASGVGGSGGAGVASSITGTSVTRAGGGGAGGTQSGGAGTGGAGGGGNGGGYIGAGVSGTANTGGGGGGGGSNNGGGSSGGSGVVIIRYPGTPVATGGTITQSGGYTIHTFTSSGTFVA